MKGWNAIKFLASGTLWLGILTSLTSANDPGDRSKVDITPFLQNGCKQIEAYSNGCGMVDAHIDCSAAGLEEKWNCGMVEVPSELSALNPKIPLMECKFYDNWEKPTREGIVYLGCGMLLVYRKYVVFKDNKFQLVSSGEEFKQLFAPVENEQEALAFAMAFTTSHPEPKIEIPEAFIREAATITPTHVEATEGGYNVHLFNYNCEGCGPHQYYAVDYLVTRDGDVTETSREDIYRDPKEDNLCID